MAELGRHGDSIPVLLELRGGVRRPESPISSNEPTTDVTDRPEPVSREAAHDNASQTSNPRTWTRRSGLVLAGALIVNMVSFGWVASSGFFIDYYKHNQFAEASDLQLSWLSSVSLALMYVASWPVAWLCVVFGPSTIIASGSAVHLLGLVLLARSTTLWAVLLTQGFVSPLGASMIFNATIPVLVQWFRRSAAVPVGIAAAGSSIGGVIYPILIQYLLPVDGFENTLMVAIAMLAGLLIFVTIAVQPQKDEPVRGSRPDFTWSQLVRPLQETYFALFSIAAAVFLGGYSIILAFIVTIAGDLGVDQPWRVLLILNGCSLFGRVIPLLVATRVGRYNTLITVTGLSSVLTFGLLYPSQNSSYLILPYSAAWGATAGAFISLIPATVTQTSPHEDIGLRIGITYFVMAWTALTWPGIAATTNDSSNTGLVLLSGLSQLVGCSLLMCARCLQTGLPSIVVI